MGFSLEVLSELSCPQDLQPGQNPGLCICGEFLSGGDQEMSGVVMFSDHDLLAIHYFTFTLHILICLSTAEADCS